MKLSKIGGKYIVKGFETSLVNEMYLDAGEELEVDIRIKDSRLITSDQRKFIFALCNEIAYYTGNESEYWRLLMQQFNANIRGIEVESLSVCSMSYANGLIDTIINFCIEKEIPFAKDLLEKNKYAFDEKQTYSMCLKRVCVISGHRAELHHLDTIGMGNDRRKISHIGKRVLPLSREYHQEAHKMGNAAFIEKYHLTPVLIDEKLEYFIKKGIIKEHKLEE